MSGERQPTDQPRPTPEVQAAGGVVWRRGPDGGIEVLVVHRPRYDDWSMPKGKLDPGEDFAAAALREVEEETGVVATLGEDLGEVRYTDHRGRPKVVRWWAMPAPDAPDAADLAPEDDDEVDELRWVPLADLDDLLSYALDVDVVTRFRATVTR